MGALDHADSQPALDAVAEVPENEVRGVAWAADRRDLLWYPVGSLLALLAASAVFALCWPGRWIG